MKTVLSSLLWLIVLIVSASGFPPQKQNPGRTERTEPGAWSDPVKGLSARLLMTLQVYP